MLPLAAVKGRRDARDEDGTGTAGESIESGGDETETGVVVDVGFEDDAGTAMECITRLEGS